MRLRSRSTHSCLLMTPHGGVKVNYGSSRSCILYLILRVIFIVVLFSLHVRHGLKSKVLNVLQYDNSNYYYCVKRLIFIIYDLNLNLTITLNLPVYTIHILYLPMYITQLLKSGCVSFKK